MLALDPHGLADWVRFAPHSTLLIIASLSILRPECKCEVSVVNEGHYEPLIDGPIEAWSESAALSPQLRPPTS
jgi:hypothetical protein